MTDPIVIIGPGAIGLLLGGLWAQAGRAVFFVARTEDRARRLTREGLRLKTEAGEERYPVRAGTEIPDDTRVLCLCVKSHQTGAALASLASTGRRPAVWSVQNGLGNAERIAAVVGPEQTFAGSTSFGATRLGRTEVCLRGRGECAIAPWSDGNLDRARELARHLSEETVPIRVHDRADRLLWQKLEVNVAINALTGLCGCPNGRVASDPDLRSLAEEAVRELRNVRERLGIPGETGIGLDRIVTVARETAENRSSLLQDLEQGRKTEIEALNGAVWTKGSDLGIDTPVNACLTRLVRARERSS